MAVNHLTKKEGANKRIMTLNKKKSYFYNALYKIVALSEDGPKFLSRGQTYRAVIGDTLLLPCQVQNLGSLVLLWRRGAAVLTAASLMVTRDDRFRLVDGYNLQITQVGPQDAGDYVCQISDRENRDQIHTVEILVPASVRTTPDSLRATARKGGAAALECRASGNPVPAVTWLRLNDSTRVGEGQQLVMDQVTRASAGKYRCIVDNGVGPALNKDFVLQVLFPPEITVERSWVHSGEGFQAELVCTVEADPPAEVSWYQDSFPISPNDRITMSSRHQNHSLLITNVQPEDFGNYSCAADNPLGRSKQHVEVSGRPGPASFHSPPLSRYPHAYNLTFELDSYPTLDELRLLYRQLMVNESFQQPGRWHDVSLVGRLGVQGSLSHRVTHELRGLRAGAVYEVIVQAKNRYGWNEVSDIFQFHTRGIMDVHAAEGGVPPPFNAANKFRPIYLVTTIIAFIITIFTSLHKMTYS
ncbi:limbic system-associated membrane protein-like [Arctopsyche grandis]|uniref:limbic system-associated membrane protein-like n=1 Tax=Arctopsyche grandis TaxID=121162 RepID=UPI00406DA0CC